METPPFIWFGGKRRVAAEVWQAFGDVDNYVEPFAGYEPEHRDHMPASWRMYAYSANKAYGTHDGAGSDEDGNGANRHLERLWFSPGCLRPNPTLFEVLDA